MSASFHICGVDRRPTSGVQEGLRCTGRLTLAGGLGGCRGGPSRS